MFLRGRNGAGSGSGGFANRLIYPKDLPDLGRPRIMIGNLALCRLAELAPLAWRQTPHRLGQFGDRPPAADRLNQHAAPRR